MRSTFNAVLISALVCLAALPAFAQGQTESVKVKEGPFGTTGVKRTTKTDLGDTRVKHTTRTLYGPGGETIHTQKTKVKSGYNPY